MKRLGIIGHPTRGKEIEKILTDLGGINEVHTFDDELTVYSIAHDNIIEAWDRYPELPETFEVYSLEQYLELNNKSTVDQV